MTNYHVLPQQVAENSLMRRPAVCAALGIKKTALYAGIAKGLYPAPIRLNSRLCVWPTPVIVELLKRVADTHE
jgi:Prophage CP4-57 regulatory protein (AlpA).